jgi:hypothetical protein
VGNQRRLPVADQDGQGHETIASTGEEPAVYTVGEAAAILRIGRNAAYELVKQWRRTGGREGLPVVALGRSLRVPAAALREMLDRPKPAPYRADPTHARSARRMGSRRTARSPSGTVRPLR